MHIHVNLTKVNANSLEIIKAINKTDSTTCPSSWWKSQRKVKTCSLTAERKLVEEVSYHHLFLSRCESTADSFSNGRHTTKISKTLLLSN